MGANSENICEAFVLLADLAKKCGVSPLNKLPSCWEKQIGNQWWIAVNGHREPMKAGSPNGASAGDGFVVQPYHAYVEFNGWPAGVIHPYGGVIAAGETANEDAFIAAIRAELERP